MSNSKLEPLPLWIKKSLQGITFWMGHRQSLYARYLLTEAAIVSELSNIIHTNLPNEQVLRCEVSYKKFIKNRSTDLSEEHVTKTLGDRDRVDLIVATPFLKDGKRKLRAAYIIEVKRAPARKETINKDIRRLLEAKKHLKRARALLFFFCERTIPTSFVSLEGRAMRGKQRIPNSDGHFIVRHVLSATGTLKNSAHYAICVEVFAT